jgi:hypothetical protein
MKDIGALITAILAFAGFVALGVWAFWPAVLS